MIFTLKDHLDALKEDELRTFQWHLNNVKLAWGPIPRSQLDNATRETTVDKMVQVYGEDGALEMMVSILKMMNRNDQATRLSQARRSSNVGLHLLGSLSSTVKENQRDAECMISVNLSHSTVIFSGPMILDSSDHQLCQNCGTEEERLYLTNTNAPISPVHSPLLSSSSILQQGPAAAPLSGPPVVSNPGVLVQSIVGMPQREINNPLSLTVPQIPQVKTDYGSYESIREPQVEPLPSSAMLAPFTPNNSLQSLPFASGSPVQRKNRFKRWILSPNRDTSQAGNAPISSVHSPLLSSSSILQQGPAAAPLSGPPVVSNPGVLVQSIVGMPQREINNPLSLTVPQIPQGKIDNGSYESIREPQVPLLLLEKITDPIYVTAPQIPQAKIDNGSYESIREPQVEPLPSSAMSPTTPASLYMQGLPLR